MRRLQTGLAVGLIGVIAVLTSKGLGTTQLITTLSTIGVLAVVDLRTNKGRAIAAEAFWIGLFVLNVGDDAHSTSYLTLDLISLLGGTALIAWLLRRAEITHRGGAV